MLVSRPEILVHLFYVGVLASILGKNAHDMVSPMPNFSRIFCPITKTLLKNRLSTRKSHFPCQKNKTFLTFRTPHLGSVTRIRSYSNWSSSPNLASKSIQNPEQHINSSIVEFMGLIVEFDLKLISNLLIRYR